MEYHFLRNNNIIIYLFVYLFISLSLNVTDVMAFTRLSQKEIIDISGRIRENEVELINIESYKNTLELKKKQNLIQFKTYQNKFYNNIIGIYKLYTVPIQNLFLSQKSNIDIAITYSLFNYYVKYLKQGILDAKEYLWIIYQNNQEFDRIKKEIIQTNIKLSTNYKALHKYLNKKNLTKQEEEDINQLTTKNKKIMKENDSLLLLMSSLNNNYLLNKDKEEDAMLAKNKGHFAFINAGFLEQEFHSKKSTDLKYNGITILSLPNSQIVAPFDGEVVFTDYFNNFDEIIIIKHSPSYYSIISGKYDSLVQPTQLVKKHEPIAISYKTITPIYYELQYRNQPINPNPWLKKPEIKKYPHVK